MFKNKDADLNYLYSVFMCEMIKDNYLKFLQKYNILAQNFINNIYFAVIEAEIEDDRNFYLIVENINTPLFVKLETFKNNDGYFVVKKADLIKKLNKKILKKLAQKGICSNVENAFRAKKYLCLHRLVASLFFNCLGLEVHHLDKNKLNNVVENLVPLTHQKHLELELDSENGKNFSINEQAYLLNKTSYKRNTLARNSELIEKILDFKSQNFSIVEIEKLIKRKIKRTKINEILNFYFYEKKFLNWLKIKSYLDCSGYMENLKT